MLHSQLLHLLPANLRWMVFFRLSAIGRFADDATIRRMYFLADDEDLSPFSHVVLTSAGRYLAEPTRQALRGANDEPPLQVGPGEPSLATVLAERITCFDLEAADCIGFGRRDTDIALLHVRLDERQGHAQALLARRPSQRLYDLLPVIGVEYVDQADAAHGCIVRFTNRLRTHIRAGQLSGFARTQNCNDFFIEQAEISDDLGQGLRQAFADRLHAARAQVAQQLFDTAGRALNENLAMRCEPPAPQDPFAYGDLVPMAMALRGLRCLQDAPQAGPPLLQWVRDVRIAAVRQRLEQRRSGALWAFHTGRLPTATDSALVLLCIDGVQAIEALRALEPFCDEYGGVLPQLSAPAAGPLHMQASAANAHWRQADMGTTVLIHALRLANGLPAVTPSDWIISRFSERAGLYFANPWWVDWCWSLAIERDPSLASLRPKLLEELLKSANPDGSFGRWDRPLSTAMAILCMDRLGYRGRALRRAQVRLINDMDSGPLAASTPFYSSFIADDSTRCETLDVEGRPHELSLYVDTHLLITNSCVAQALAVAAQVDENEAAQAPGEPHARYRCDTPQSYIAGHALPPYVKPSGLVAAPHGR